MVQIESKLEAVLIGQCFSAIPLYANGIMVLLHTRPTAVLAAN